MSSEIRHALVERSLGFYTVWLPPDYAAPAAAKRSYPLGVLLHGQGGTEQGIAARWLPAVGRESWVWITLRAPYAHEEAFAGGTPGWRAWPMAWPRWRDPDFPREDVEDLGVPGLYTDWIAACVADVRRRYHVSQERSVVVGHSEGATYAHAFAAAHPESVRAYFASAGGPYDFTLEDGVCARALKAHAVRPFLAHARSDEENAFEGSRLLAEYLEANGVEFETFFFEGTDHAPTPGVLQRAREFVRGLVEPTR